jgi:hypothetical protein
VDAFFVDALDLRGDAQVVAATQVRIEVRRFERGADAPPGRVQFVAAIAPEHPERAAAGRDDAEQHADGGGLPAAVGAEEAEDLAFLDGE